MKPDLEKNFLKLELYISVKYGKKGIHVCNYFCSDMDVCTSPTNLNLDLQIKFFSMLRCMLLITW